jgi:catechol 2,3-dioxygenase-like lactoylglutathione lyase family enzyme
MKLNRIILYVRNIEKSVQFYETYFGFRASQHPGDRITELSNPEGGAILMLHQASRGMKRGQASVKLIFDVQDVISFCAQCAEKGLDFGPIHEAEGINLPM